MLKFAVMLLCVLCCPRQIYNAPVIKASGVQWTEPKGNGKGNLTLIMIPQNNSCTNDTDMLIAVKSDYQVVSQDTQLLNLVINEYQNDSVKELKLNNENLTQINGSNEKFENFLESTCNEEIAPKPTECSSTSTECSPSTPTECSPSTPTECSPSTPTECSLSTPSTNNNLNNMIDLDSCTIKAFGIKNDAGDALLLDTSRNQSNDQYLLSGMSNEGLTMINQKGDVLSSDENKNIVNNNQDINTSDSVSNVDFLKLLNAVGEVEQHPQLDSIKGSNKAMYYEADKKMPSRVNEKNNANDGNHNVQYSKNVSAEDVFKFLSAAQVKETTASAARNPLDVMKFLETNKQIFVQTTLGLSTKNKFVTVSNYDAQSLSSKGLNTRVFNDSEINIFKNLNVSEQTILKQLQNLSAIDTHNGSPQKEDSDQVVNIITSNVKQEPMKDTRNLRSDPLSQTDELVDLDEEDIDSKVKLSKGYYAPNEGILKSKLSLLNLNKDIGQKLEGNGGSESSSGVPTTCYTVQVSADGKSTNANPADSENAAPAINTEASISSTEASTPTAATEVSNPPNCRTSIIYICDDSKTPKPQAAVQGEIKKITLQPQINCAEYLKTRTTSGTATDNPSNQNVVFKKNALQPLIESSLFLANKNEIVKGKDVPVLLNASSDNLMDSLLSSHGEKLAKLHSNPSDPTINEEMLEDIPPKHKTGRERPNEKGENTRFKNLNSMTNERIVRPGDFVNVRFAGGRFVIEQMPSYRSEKFDKNCNSTSLFGTQNDETEPDEIESENEAKSGTHNHKTKKPASEKNTLGQTEPHQTSIKPTLSSEKEKTSQPELQAENIETTLSSKKEKASQTELQAGNVETTLSSKKEKTSQTELPAENIKTTVSSKKEKTSQTEPQPENIETTMSSKKEKTSQTELQAENIETTLSSKKEKTSQTELQAENIIETTLSITEQVSSKKGKTSQTEYEGSVKYVTECKVLTTSSQSRSRLPITVSSEDHSLELNVFTTPVKKETVRSEVTSTLPTDEIFTTIPSPKQPHISTSKQKISSNKQSGKQNLKIPGDSVKEIVIQIVRNTKPPGKGGKQCFVDRESNNLINDISLRSVKNQRPLLPKAADEKVSVDENEVESTNEEISHMENKQHWAPMPKQGKTKTEIKNNNKYNRKPFSRKESILLDNFYIGKENKEVNSDVFEGGNKHEKAHTCSDLKLFANDNDAINNT